MYVTELNIAALIYKDLYEVLGVATPFLLCIEVNILSVNSFTGLWVNEVVTTKSLVIHSLRTKSYLYTLL